MREGVRGVRRRAVCVCVCVFVCLCVSVFVWLCVFVCPRGSESARRFEAPTSSAAIAASFSIFCVRLSASFHVLEADSARRVAIFRSS